MKKVSLLFLLALLCALPFHLSNVKANEKIFNLDSADSARLVDGITKADLETAYEAEGQRLLAADFNMGTIQNPFVNGWQGSVLIAAHLTGSSSTASIWGAGYAFVIYNANTKAAYTVKDDFAGKYAGTDGSWGFPVNNYGWPCSNEFTVGDVTYQNFSFGVMQKNASGISWVAGKNVNADGTEANIELNQYVDQMPYQVYDTPAGASITKYKTTFKAALEGKTYNYPFVENMRLDWPSEAAMVQFVDGTEFSNATLWGGTNKGYLVYSSEADGHVAMVDEFGLYWTTEYTTLGFPKAEAFAVNDLKYQNFAAGYVKLDGEDVVFVPSKQMGADGTEEVLFSSDDIGKLAEGITLPEGITAGDVTTAFNAKYSEEMGTPSTYVELYPGSQVLRQKFINDEGKISYIYFSDADHVYAINADVYAKYQKPEGYDLPGDQLLGLPIGDAFSKDGKTYQNFYKGYLEISDTSAKAVCGATMKTDGTRTIIDFSDSIFVSSGIKIPASYNVTAEQLLAKFKAKYTAMINTGFAVGVPSNEGIKDWTEYERLENNEFNDNRGMIVLAFTSGDSTAKPWYNTTMYFVYSPEAGEVFCIRDEVMTGIASFRSQLGAPRGEAFKVGNVTIQNFQMGYITATQMGSVSYKDNLNYNKETGKEVNLDGTPVEDIPNPDVPIKPEENDSNILPIILGVTAGIIVIAGGVVGFIFWKKKRG